MASENWVDLKIPFKITLHVFGFRAGQGFCMSLHQDVLFGLQVTLLPASRL